MSKSSIEWTEETWNPITGCTKYSEGCKNCYAEKMHKRLKRMRSKKYQHFFSDVVVHPEELNRNFGKKPKMIFVNSMSDTFHGCVTNREIGQIIYACSKKENHIFQILTKRTERLNNFTYPKNVWLGVTVEHPDYKHRIDNLRKTDAKVKFLSCEPLLGDLGELDLTGIDWVICGGESGHNARPCHPDWVRNIQRQCAEQGVPFFFKQWGEWVPGCVEECENKFALDKNGELHDAIKSLWSRSDCIYISKVGKKKAGCLLDGKEYKEFPKAVQAC